MYTVVLREIISHRSLFCQVPRNGPIACLGKKNRQGVLTLLPVVSGRFRHRVPLFRFPVLRRAASPQEFCARKFWRKIGKWIGINLSWIERASQLMHCEKLVPCAPAVPNKLLHRPGTQCLFRPHSIIPEGFDKGEGLFLERSGQRPFPRPSFARKKCEVPEKETPPPQLGTFEPVDALMRERANIRECPGRQGNLPTAEILTTMILRSR